MTHYYHIKNTTQQPIHIASVRVSCGCTTATIMQQDVAPGQTSAIMAQMDTRRFSAAKTVTIYVTFDQPQWEEARLSISAYGRDDVTYDATGITFGSVTHGESGIARTTVTLRQTNWAVTRAASDSAYVTPVIREVSRNGADVTYEVAAKLQAGLPIGRWTTDITLTTNSPVAPTIKFPATVEVNPALTASPGEVKLGAVSMGQPTESKLMIKSPQPFKIKEIHGTTGVVATIPTADEARAVHVITVKFDAKQSGQLDGKIHIVTDLPNENTMDVPVKATVTGK